jgi:signal transduction histidine kinase
MKYSKLVAIWPILSGVVLIGSLGTMSAVHYLQIKASEQKTQELSRWVSRERLGNEMITAMEEYRHLSASFRKLGEGESSAAKTHLRQTFVKKSEALENLGLAGQDKPLLAEANDRLSQFLVQSAKAEPQLFTRNYYQRPEAVQLHNQILAPLKQIVANAQGAEAALYQPESTHVFGMQSMAILLFCSALILLVAVGSLLITYFRNVSPAEALRKLSSRYREGELPEAKPALRGLYGEIDATLRELASTVRNQRFEKHEFITAVTSELRSPLLNLRTGLNLFEHCQNGSTQPEEDRHQARNIIERSSLRLSRCLDDLTDIVETENNHLNLNEKVVDLGELVQSMTRISDLNPVNTHAVRVKPISTPLWANVDSEKLERALSRLVRLLMDHSPGGAAIELSVQSRNDSAFKGVEILIEEADRFRAGRAGATGPEQDLLKHWVSANGYGMKLTEKIVKAHGGSITASGVVGTGVLFIVRIPQYRVAVASGASRSFRSALRLETTAAET